MTMANDTAQKKASDSALLRVSSEKIGKLMDLVGELSLSVAETISSPELKDLDLVGFEAASHRLSMLVREVQDAATELRLVPVSGVFRRLKRMVRELERETGKNLKVIIEGEETAVDKMVADRLYDPLLHVVRNSADHGIQSPEVRKKAGKPSAGTIKLSATQVGNEVRIVVEDDGQGLNREKILKAARNRGFFGPEEEPEDSNLWKVIFEPGFSTAESVTTLSGRGVGMDVLNSTMKDLRARIAVDSNEGEGTAVSLHIPVSLAFIDSIIVRLGTQLFTVPVDDIAEIVQPDMASISRVSAENCSETLKLRGEFVRVFRLDKFYRGLASEATSLSDMIAIVFHTTDGRIAVPVNEVLDRQQVVMKPLTGALRRVRASSGCALLASGEVAIVLDCERLVKETR